jgi:hypothetical protein
MSITIKPVGLLKRYCRGSHNGENLIVIDDSEAGRSIGALCRDAGLPLNMISLFVVNGRKVTRSYQVRAGDAVKCVAVIGGG